jgi:5-methyltetrahydrofolate--homocysteine methyltransferase
MVADMVRAAGFEVIDLGSDLPMEAFVEAVQHAEAMTAAVSVITSAPLPAAAEVVAAIHASTGTPVLVGGPAVRDARHAAEIGADGFGGDGSGAVTWINSLLA